MFRNWLALCQPQRCYSSASQQLPENVKGGIQTGAWACFQSVLAWWSYPSIKKVASKAACRPAINIVSPTSYGSKESTSIWLGFLKKLWWLQGPTCSPMCESLVPIMHSADSFLSHGHSRPLSKAGRAPRIPYHPVIHGLLGWRFSLMSLGKSLLLLVVSLCCRSYPQYWLLLLRLAISVADVLQEMSVILSDVSDR